MPLIQMHSPPFWDIEVYYHREKPVGGDWWMQLPQYERDLIFAEGRTPRIVPLGKWNWEIGGDKKAHKAGRKRRACRKLRSK